MRIRHLSFLLSAAVLLLICGQPVMAQTGKLVVHATPPQAYIYVDGAPIVDAKVTMFVLRRESIKSICITTAISLNPAMLRSRRIRPRFSV